jgi:hypothetical protein
MAAGHSAERLPSIENRNGTGVAYEAWLLVSQLDFQGQLLTPFLLHGRS